MNHKLPIWAVDNELTGRSATKSAGIAIGSGLARLLASFFGALVLARFLSPEDFGLIAIATPIILLVGAFADGGVSTYTLQSKQVTHRNLTLSFWLAIVTGLGVACFVALTSPLAAWLFKDERLIPILSALAFSILFSSIGSQHNALTKKFHRQDIYGIAEIIAAVSSLLGSVYIAYLGGEYWALVAIPVIRQLVHTTVVVLATGWVPGVPFVDTAMAKTIMGFSAYIIIFQIVNVLNKSIDKWMLGYHQDPEVLGYYAMAVSIMMLPSMQLLSPIGGAIIPHFSKVYHHENDRFGSVVRTVMVLLVSLICPAMIWASAYSELLLGTVLGEKWLMSAPVFSVLALASIAMTILSVVGWTYTSIGNSKVLSNLALFSVVILTITSAYGAMSGAVILAWVVLFNFILMILLYFTFIIRDRNVEIPVLRIFLDITILISWSSLVVYTVVYLNSYYSINSYADLVFSFVLSILFSVVPALICFSDIRRQITVFRPKR
jgi:PST family polysaccharide transporter